MTAMRSSARAVTALVAMTTAAACATRGPSAHTCLLKVPSEEFQCLAIRQVLSDYPGPVRVLMMDEAPSKEFFAALGLPEEVRPRSERHTYLRVRSVQWKGPASASVQLRRQSLGPDTMEDSSCVQSGFILKGRFQLEGKCAWLTTTP
jgi:hypothetical protein